MAQRRDLRHPPIQEAVMQFEFEGTSLSPDQLERLAEVYVAQGWERQKIHNFQAVINTREEPQDAVVTTNSAFLGLVVIDPQKVYRVQLLSNAVAASNTRPYSKWEVLTEYAKRAFEEFVQIARPQAVKRISARFINRIPPVPELTGFEQILERPPLPLEDLPGATVTDFLRRHVVAGLPGGFTANLTIGTVAPEAGEGSHGKALVIDTDVFKFCHIEPNFDLLKSDLATLRSIKNTLFFGSLKNAIVEKFV
jgi:uncharacterized protein (TIGR04255 family)